MKFSFEVPTSYLKDFNKVNEYDFILAHKLMQDTDYFNFYKKSRKYKILDNGAAELGKSIDTNELTELAIECKADVLVLPDVWMDGKHTYEQSIKTLMDIKLKYPKEFKRLKFMYVLQGKSFTELEKYYNLFIDKSLFIMKSSQLILGVPYLTCAKVMNLISPTDRDDDVTNSRIHLIQKLRLPQEGYDIHLLGAGFNYSQEISFMRHYKQVKTMDTSTPFILATQGIKLDPRGLFEREIGKAGTLDFNAKFNKKILDSAIHNAKRLKSFSNLKEV